MDFDCLSSRFMFTQTRVEPLKFTANLLNQDRSCLAMSNVYFKQVSIRHKTSSSGQLSLQLPHLIANCYWYVSIIRGTAVS